MRYALWGLLLTLGCSGSGSGPGGDGVIISDGLQSAGEEGIVTVLPAVISSELTRKGGNFEMLSPVTLKNEANIARDLVFEKTGCSCYGVLLDGVELKSGAKISFAAGEERPLLIKSHPGKSERESDYRANFHWEQAGEHIPYSVLARVRVIEDARIANQVTRQVLPEHLGHEFTHELELLRSARSRELVNQPPVLKCKEEFVSLKSCRVAGEPQEVDPGIWRQTWTVTLAIVPPLDLAADQPVIILDLICPSANEDQEANPVVAKSQMVLRLQTPIQYPPKLAVGRVPVGTPRNRRVLIKSTQQVPFSLQPSEEFKGTAEITCPTERQIEHWVEVTYTPQAAGPFEERLLLVTDNKVVPTLEILLSGVAFESTSATPAVNTSTVPAAAAVTPDQ